MTRRSLHIAGSIFGMMLLGFLLAAPVFAQETKGIPLIDHLLTENKLTAANSALQSQMSTLESQNNTDSLAKYTYYVGKIALLSKNEEAAVQSVELFLAHLKAQNAKARTIRQAYLELASFYGTIGRFGSAYKSNEQAQELTQKMKHKTGEDAGIIENNLGVLARQMGDITLSIKHHRRALSYFKEYAATKKENYFISYNNMGAMMWYSSKTDSALFYYDNALEMLEKMKPSPMNLYYRPANVLNNKAALYSISGKTTEALETMKDAVQKYSQFLEVDKIGDARLVSARQALFRSIENLGGVYKELGNYSKTRKLLAYSYRQKKKYLSADNPEIFKTQILLGQIEFSLKNYDKALEYLNAGIKNFKRAPEEFLFWRADAYATKALLYDETNRPGEAALFFKQSEMLYEKANGGSYDAIYLGFLSDLALFYAENGDGPKALQKARKALRYVVKNEGETSLSAFKHRLNLASVYYELGRYREAAEYSRQSLTILQQKGFRRDHLMDSVQVEFKKPKAILLQSKAEYQLESEPDTTFLIKQLHRLDAALALLDKRKALLSTDEDLKVEIADNEDLFDFAKKIALKLYQKTGNQKYLNRIIGFHESALYNRIRARINARQAMQFAYIPQSVVKKEHELKKDMAGRLQANEIDGYVDDLAKWQAFLEMLKKDYPRYFALRYESLEQKIGKLSRFIPENTAVVRYLFFDKKLYALLMQGNEEELIELNYSPVSDHISRLHKNAYDAAKTGQLLYELYTHIWKPLENKIQGKRLVIIPDGELFNLSFETLPTAPVTTFAGLAEKSLLARYAISYQYSLYMLQKDSSPDFNKGLVAFAPGFDENLKRKYKTNVKNALFLDHTYLTLLPQPFTVDLVDKLQDDFDGTIFTGEESTVQTFISRAGNHRIIHIGTHAESNNLSPELSCLFFAKDQDSTAAGTNNSLYAYEIYNYDLNSDLTLLTACETGKPQYEPGEGMISLAHAFNYAGSRSLLTSLWNIDEQSSSQIVDLFYQNLSDGQTKDVALQRAKLAYLKTAQGRTLAPEYWAGLILMGDSGAILIERTAPPWAWLFAGLILMVVAAGYLWFNRSRV